MADNKKYYYLKLKEDFFDSDEMLLLQGMKDGYLYSDILMKMYLRSLKNEGRLMYKDYIPYSLEMISTITRHQVGTVERAMKIFEQLKLVEVLDNGAIYMMDIQNFIGQSSTEADRQRKYYRRIQDEKKLSGSKVPEALIIYAMRVLALLYDMVPDGETELNCNWGDGVLEDTEAEYQRRWSMVVAGKLKTEAFLAWYFGCSEEEAKNMMPEPVARFPTEE